MVKRADGYRIKEIWAFLSVDPRDNAEGIMGAHEPGQGWIPFVCADEARVRSLRPMAIAMAKASRLGVKLVKFSVRTDVEEISCLP
jgi:hypothetical protein